MLCGTCSITYIETCLRVEIVVTSVVYNTPCHLTMSQVVSMAAKYIITLGV